MPENMLGEKVLDTSGCCRSGYKKVKERFQQKALGPTFVGH